MATSTFRRILLAGLGAALLTPVAAQAQSFVGVGPVRSFVLPGSPAAGDADAGPASLTPAPVPEVEPKPEALLRALPSTAAGRRFEGEWAEKLWPLYLTPGQAGAPATLRLAFLSAISVMPEGSRIVAELNGRPLGTVSLARPDGVVARDFAVPPGLLRDGANALRLRVEQRHRVDCSPAATHELWTVLDPARSGLVLAGGAAGYGSPADIAAVPPRADGAFAIHLAASGKVSPALLERAARAVQIAALAAGTQHPVVTLEAEGSTAKDGLMLALGGAEPVGPMGFGFVPGAARPVFAVSGGSEAELDTALARWEAQRLASTMTGSEPGLAAWSQRAGHAASGRAERVALRETGFAGAAFGGRRFRHAFDIVMPGDFLPADYDRVALDLAGRHAGGLSRDAHVLVSVNGRESATQRLKGGSEGDLGGSFIFLPLSLMRPGANRIEIVAEVARPEDAACAAVPGPRLTLLDTSEIMLPRIARIGRTPELAATGAGALPFAAEGARPVLYLPQPDRETVGAALTLAARLAVAAGRPLDFAFTVEPPAAGTGPVLAVSPARRFDPAVLAELGLDPAALERAWRPLAERKPGREPPVLDAYRLARQCRLPSLPLAQPVPATDARSPGIFANLPLPGFLKPRADEGVATVERVVAARALALVGQGHRSGAAGQGWTLVSAPDSATLAAAAECLSHPAQWNRLAGRVAALTADEEILTVAATEQRFVGTQGFSLPNARLVAAGWLSMNPLAYVGLALALVLVLAFATLTLVLNSGRRQE